MSTLACSAQMLNGWFGELQTGSRIAKRGGSVRVNGYLHPGYAESLAEFGTPRELLRCGGWVLERQIPDFSYSDGMGCYPLFCCSDWSQLHKDLQDIDDLVALALVTDPFGSYTPA